MAQLNSLTPRIRPSGLIMAAATVLFMGCGGTSDIPQLNEAQLVEGAVSSVGDAAGSDESFSAVFAGSVPDNRQAYFSVSIEIVGEPEIDGDSATATVKISQGSSEDEGKGATKTTQVAAGEVTWTLKKVSGEWKIDSAPLPEV